MRPIIRLGVCNMIFFLCSQFASIFINIYVYQDFRSLHVNGLYNAIMYTAWIAAFFVGTAMCRVSTKANIIVSAGCGIGALTLLMSMPHGVLVLDMLVGAVIGVASGFYWVAYNVIFYQFSTTGERGQTMARFSLATGFIAMAMPSLSGFVIHALGYKAAFGLIMALFIVILVLALGFPALRFSAATVRAPEVTQRRTQLLPRGFGTFAIALVSCSFYMHFIGFASGVLLYSYGSGVMGAGWMNTLYALLSLMVNTFIGYGIRSRSDRHRQTFGWIGALIATVGTAFLFSHSRGMLIGFNVIVSMANPLFFSLLSAQQFDTVGQMYPNVATGFLVRESLYSVARIGLFAYIAVFGLQAGTTTYVVYIGLLCIAPLLAVAWNLRATRLPSIMLK